STERTTSSTLLIACVAAPCPSPPNSLRSRLVLGGACGRPVSLKAPLVGGLPRPLSLFGAPLGQELGSGNAQAVSLRLDRLSYERSRPGSNEVRVRCDRYCFRELWGRPGLVRHDVAAADSTRLHTGSGCRCPLTLPYLTALHALLIGQLWVANPAALLNVG